MKLKYDLEKNVSLVNFEKNRIEIFNDNLDKNFVKDLSSKLLIGLVKDGSSLLAKKGQMSIRDKIEKRSN